MDEKLQSGEQALQSELAGSAEAAAAAAEAAAEQATTAADEAVAAVTGTAEAAQETAEAVEEAAEEAAAGTEEEILSPEAAFAEAMMADRGPAEDLPIEELPLAEKPVRAAITPEQKKRRTILFVILGVVVAAGLLALSLFLTRDKNKAEPAASGESSVSANSESSENSRVDMDEMMKYGPFAYTDESLSEKYNSQIAATVGDHQLTGSMLQIFYWSMVYQDLNENADYLSFRGPDTTRPFAEQKYGEVVNWEQHYLQVALDYYLQNVSLYDEALKAGTTVSAETQELLDNLAANIASQASEYGFDNVEDYLAQSFGPNVSMDDYLEYYRISSLAYTYATDLQKEITVTDDEISAFYDEHEAEYAEQGVEKNDQNVVNVRHILVMPEVDTDSDGDGENDSSSQDAWDAALQRINEIYADWKEEPTEDGFAILAGKESDDTGSTESGGLYESVYPGQMVDEFNDWCFDPSRKPGDNGIVQTQYGYHLMYFVSEGDQPYWKIVAKDECVYDKFNKVIDEIFSKYEIKPDYENLHIFDIVSRAAAANAAASEE